MSDPLTETDASPSSAQETYAHGYDTMMTLQGHAGRTATVQANWFLPFLQPDIALLDCGCGSGSITVGLARAVAPAQVTGVDISAAEIERAQAREATEGIPNVHFQTGNLYHLDFPDNHFGALFSHNVLEHLSEPERALLEMRRVLKPGGIIGIRDVDMGGVLLTPDEPLIQQWQEIYEADWRAVGGHPRLGRHLRRLLIEAGFHDVQASASYEVYSDADGLRFASQLAVSRVQEPDYVTRVVENGLADHDQLTAIAAAWTAWHERDDAFFALAHGEVVGRKP